VSRACQIQPLPSLFFKINENQLAFKAAILELSNWVEMRGPADVAGNVRGDLNKIDRNEEFIKMSLAVLMTPERPCFMMHELHDAFKGVRYRAKNHSTLSTSRRAPLIDVWIRSTGKLIMFYHAYHFSFIFIQSFKL